MRLPPNRVVTLPALSSIVTLVALATLGSHAAFASGPDAAPTGAETAVWVHFRDRGALERASLGMRRAAARAQLSERSWKRRLDRGGSSAPLETDLPVDAGYVRALEAEGFAIRAVSRWKNAASVVASPADWERLRNLPFVNRLEPVLRLRRSPDPDSWERERAVPEGDLGADSQIPFPVANAPGTPAFYGPSYAQNHISGADLLHAQGLSGAGVLVAVLDTGFRETHAALDSLDVVARRDFIHGDEVVSNEPGQDISGNQESHGTYVLSALAGYWPGVHVGTAYGAQVALGKTEKLGSETVVEMDYWQMGAEWADSLGADVLSTSLGYSTFDDPADSYSYFDLDGETTVITRAAAEAARRGITVVTAQGNAGAIAWHYLLAPADGDTVCAVGAVDSLGTIASFSSYGPTADGRIKPDVCSMGVSVRATSVSSNTQFLRVGGTSLATPLIAGIVALLLEAHPTWGPYEVLEALRSTADRANAPHDQYGYGIARAGDAVDWVPSTVGAPEGVRPGLGLVILAAAPGQAGLRFQLEAGERGGESRLDLYDVRGRRVERVWAGILAPAERAQVAWPNPENRARGIYWARLRTPDGEASRRAVLLW